MNAEQIIREIQELDTMEFSYFLDAFEKSSIIGELLVEKWKKEKITEGGK